MEWADTSIGSGASQVVRADCKIKNCLPVARVRHDGQDGELTSGNRDSLSFGKEMRRKSAMQDQQFLLLVMHASPGTRGAVMLCKGSRTLVIG